MKLALGFLIRCSSYSSYCSRDFAKTLLLLYFQGNCRLPTALNHCLRSLEHYSYMISLFLRLALSFLVQRSSYCSRDFAKILLLLHSQGNCRLPTALDHCPRSLEHYSYTISLFLKLALGFLVQRSSYCSRDFAKTLLLLPLQGNCRLPTALDHCPRSLEHYLYMVNQFLKPALGFLVQRSSRSSYCSRDFAKILLLLHLQGNCRLPTALDHCPRSLEHY